jgi:hypothetical protein
MSRHCVQSVVRSNNEDAVCTRDITAQTVRTASRRNNGPRAELFLDARYRRVEKKFSSRHCAAAERAVAMYRGAPVQPACRSIVLAPVSLCVSAAKR